MCGISGIVSFTGYITKDIINSLNDTLSHRGPDNGGYYINSDKTVSIAQRRLSIIDLSESANQPICNEQGNIWLVYNGEIYNFQEIKNELQRLGHVFKSNSDSEIIVHGYEEWGQRILNKLRGMFAFAIWDEKKNELFAARDHTGIKPFNYYFDKNKFIFASELKAIFEHKGINKEIDETAVYDYFTYNYIPTPKTILKNAFKLPPGHFLVLKEEKLTITEYWDVDFTKTIKIDEDKAIELLKNKIEECVAINLISDLPIGVFLSGGLDSGTVATFASEHYKGKLDSFSLGYENYTNDERPYAKIIADKLNLNHHEIVIKHDEIKKSIASLPRLYDEPFADSSAIPTYLLCTKAKKNATVVLSGDGGDEIFGGYSWYPEILSFNKKQKLLKKLGFLKNIFILINKNYPFKKGKGVLRSLSSNFWDYYCYKLGGVSKNEKSRILSADFLAKFKDYDDYWYFKKHWKPELDPFTRMQYLDFKTYMHDDVLTKVDRASMASSLEVRVPLLDHTLIELVATFPVEIRNKSNARKYLFKKVVENILPKAILNKPKTGFGVPLEQYFSIKDIPESNNIFLKNILTKNLSSIEKNSNDIYKLIELIDSINVIDHINPINNNV
jgi:asparagine synthase (glutamine-hydrolysing)